MAEFEDEEVSTGSARPATRGGRRVESETFDNDAVSATPGARPDVEHETADDLVNAGGLKMKASTLALLEKAAAADPEDTSGDPDDEGLVKPGDIVDTAEKPDPDDPDAAPPKDDPAPAGEQKTETPPPAPEVDAIREENTRLAEANKALLEEVERYKASKPSAVPDRLKPFVDGEQMYFDDSIGAVRMWIASALGVEKDSKEVDAELAHLYTDLTSKELNVPLDQSVKAAREAARARQALARDKRERKAEIEAQEARAKEEAAARTAKETASKIESQLKADQYPLLVNLSSDLTGVTPGEAVWRVLEQEVKMGRINPKQSDDKLIAAAAKILEDRFTAVRDKIAKAQPPQPKDTAKDEKKPAEAKSPSEGKRQNQGAPITNKAASVAPPTPPKPPAEQKPAASPPKFKTSRAYKEHLLEKHGIK